jgi:hypothetical protein
MSHFDIVSKVAAIQVDGIATGLRFNDLKDTFEAQANFSPQSNVAKKLRNTFDFLDRVFPKKNRILRNRSTIQSFATLASLVVDSGQADGCEERLRRFFESFTKELSHQVELGNAATDPDYLQFQTTLSANVKGGAKTRHEILLRKLLLFDPSFVEILGPESVTASGMEADIKRLGESVASKIESVNERYAAEKGQDLFKATNKTSAALMRLSKQITDYEAYKSFIDDMYFIFHEGIGQRLADKLPPTFADINNLRTALQHDVDHGKTSKVAAKKKQLGESFKKYSGESSPAGLAPDRFPIIQASLLRAVEAELQTLTW